MGLTVISKLYTDIEGRTGIAVQGNALDTSTLETVVELSTRLDLSPAVQVEKVGNTFTLLSGNWSEKISAFNTADIEFKITVNGNPITTTVSYVDGADMTLVNGTNAPDGFYPTGFFQINEAPEQFEMKFNLPTNTVGTGNSSLIDGEEVRFSVILVNALNPLSGDDNYIQLGTKSGGSTFPVNKVSRLDDVDGNMRYMITTEFKFWVVMDLAPFFTSEAVGVNVEHIVYMLEGDPSVSTTSTSFQAGNTGGKNERFNGYPSIYSLSSIDWTDASGNPMVACDFSQESRFTIVIDGTFVGGDKINFKMFMFPNDSSEYMNLPSALDNNIMLAINPTLIPVSTPTNITGALNDNGEGYDITDLSFTNSGTFITVIGKFIPNVAFSTAYALRDIQDKKYKIWIPCENNTKSFKEANTVNVDVEFNNMKENILPLGKWGGMNTFEMFNHNDDLIANAVYLEDDLRSNILFTLPKDTANQPWTGFSLRLIAENDNNGDRFILEETFYNTSLIPQNVVTGIVPLAFTEDRGFKLPATSDKKEVVIELYPALDDGSNFGVRASYPFLVDYRSWQALLTADAVFYGGQTKNWYPYSAQPDWTVKMEIGIQIATGEYINDFPVAIHNYNDWGETPGSSITFQTTGGLPLAYPYANAVCEVIATHEIDTEDFTGNEWATINVYPKEGDPKRLIGSVLDWSETDNPLFPKAGETKGELIVGLKTVTVKALFDPSKINYTNQLTFTSRVSGNILDGIRANIFKLNTAPKSKPNRPTVPASLEENRGGDFCCCPPFLVLADMINSPDDARHRNDVTSAYEFGDTVVFTLLKDGVVTSYTPVSTPLPFQSEVQTTTIEWRDVLISDGAGTYELTVTSTVAGQVEPTYTWAKYCLMPYQSGNIYNGEGTSRVLVWLNDVNMKLGMNFTGSYLLTSLRLKGKFGYDQGNTVIENTEYVDAHQEKIRRMDKNTYELRTGRICIDTVKELRKLILGENNCWVSDHNYDSPDRHYDVNVIVKEGYIAEYENGSREQKGTIVFENKILNCRTFFQDPRQTAQAILPPMVCPPSVVTEATGLLSLATAQTISTATGDDGDTQRGRPFFTLQIVGAVQQLNYFGSKWRWTGVTGGYYDRDTLQYKDINGLVTTRILAYPDDLRCDWATRNSVDDFTMYKMTVVHFGTWDVNRLASNSQVVGGFSGWTIANDNEYFALRQMTPDTVFIIPETALSSLGTNWWSSTESKTAPTTHAIVHRQDGSCYPQPKSGGGTSIQVRITNTSEL